MPKYEHTFTSIVHAGTEWLGPVDHVLSELSTMTQPSWMALQDMAHGFTELHKAVVMETLYSTLA